MDPIKEAFFKIKKEIETLKKEIYQLKIQLNQNKTIQTQNQSNTIKQTDIQTHNQTHNEQILQEEGLYCQNTISSIGNKGVPTDKHTHQQTHQHIENNTQIEPVSEFRQINNILNSLDSIKQEIRTKFKQLTPQEMLVFSVIYTTEEQKEQEITYKTISKKMNLSESSIRDYTNKLIKKGIPIQKTRKNNKTILLKISNDLKNVVTLATIQNLREL